MKGGSGTALKTLVIGLDGACFRVLEPMFARAELPNLSAIFEDGASGVLESQVPPWTPSAWPSLYTGTNPGKHGVFGFLEFDGYDWDVVNASHVKQRTLWDIVDYHGGSSVVVNAPVTYPPPEVDGAVVPGYLAPENPRCHPAGILDEIKDAIGNYRVYASLESTPNASTDARVEEYGELAGMRGAAFRYLADRYDPTFGFLQFQHTDTVLHEFPEDEDAVSTVYGAVDDEVGHVLDACDPDTVFVVSDHGLGPYRKRVRVNEFLRDAGIVEAVRGGAGMPTWSSIRNESLAEGLEGGRRARGPIERMVTTVASMGLTAQRVGDLLDRFGKRELFESHVPAALIRAASEQVDFPNSAAYVRSRIECGVRINLVGREPNGVVSPERYDAVREELIALLSDFKTPSGDPVFDDVAPREEYFHGPYADRSVDVVTVPRDFDYYVTTWLMGDYFGDPDPPGWDHKLDGVLAAAGDGIDHEAALTSAHLFDIAPTVLAALGFPRGSNMDGRVLPLVTGTGEQRYPPMKPDEGTTIDDEGVEARLEQLGYLE